MKLLKQALIVIVCVVVLAEIALRIMGTYKVYSEKTRNEYVIGYGETRDSWYYTHTPNKIDTPLNSDFTYERAINSLGLREKEVVAKDTSKKRILVLGDSFAEGVGAPYDSTWPRIMEKLLNQVGQPNEVIDAGVAGSDVFYEYVLYRDKLKELKPDVIIVSINASDYTDYIYRGGIERFLPDSTVINRPAPWFEPLFHYSHFFRGGWNKINGYNVNGMFVSIDDYADIFKEANQKFMALLKNFDTLAKQNGAKLCVVIHNTPVEIIYPIDVNLASIAYLSNLNTELNGRGIQSIDVSPTIIAHYKNAKPESYSYLNDMHYTPAGYYYLAQQITDSLTRKFAEQLHNPLTR